MRIPLFFLAFCLCVLPRHGGAEKNYPQLAKGPPTRYGLHSGNRSKPSPSSHAQRIGIFPGFAGVNTLHKAPDKKLQLPTFSVLRKVESFQLNFEKNEKTQEITVKYPPILPNSERITDASGTVLVRGIDYQIDFYLGKITLQMKGITPQSGEHTLSQKQLTPITVTYRTLPFAIKQVYKRDLYGGQTFPGMPLTAPPGARSEGQTPDDATQAPTSLTGEPIGAPASQLEVSGSQTFGISIGSGRDLSQNQELRINVEGKVSENIAVIAMLSDQDLPIQPEGTTENIQDIDQKLIRITHPNMRGTLGDFEGSLGQSDLIFFPRALEGVQVEGDFKWGRFHLIPSAIPKGQSTSLVIRGEEGRGEYRLTVDGQYVIVKAGSEIVWLNGERMRRGENNDYVIREYGDAIVEFNSKHLITSNDMIRVDFEYIPEERAYQQNLYGLSSVFTLPGERITLGASYAVESDLSQPEQALIILDDKDLDALRQHKLDADGDGTPLTPPQKHTVWGLESRLNLTEQAWLEGQLAYSAVDKNTYSTVDRKEVSQAWKLLGYAGWEKLSANLDVRSMDANFVPVGASSSNRTRSRYETQYAKEGFDDAFLLNTPATSQVLHDERTVNFDIQVIPTYWLAVDAGVGRTAERAAVESERALSVSDFTELDAVDTVRNNFNWGVDFNRGRRLSRKASVVSSQLSDNEASDVHQNSLPTENQKPNTDSDSLQNILKRLPNLRWDDYRSTSRMEGTGAAEDFRKSRQEGNLSYPLGPFKIIGTLGRLESSDARNATLNRKRQRTTGQINLVDFKWASLNTSYEFEEAFAKESLLTVDAEPLGLSDWQRSTTARTWKVGIFSQQRKWVNLTTNLARRMLKAHTELGTNTTTQLADVTLHLTPLHRAIDIEVTYELDKKLTSQRREIYTNIHPHTGHPIQPGEGYFVKLDDLHYVEDLEQGTYIKIYQNVGDKPTTAVDAEFRFRFQPRQFFARRARSRQQQQNRSTMMRDSLRPAPPASSQGDTAKRPGQATSTGNTLEWFLNALRGQTRLWLTEEQEAADAVSLYLLQNLQGSQTLFGRINQHHRLEFSPSPQFAFELNLRTGRTLNLRINTQERRRHHRTWDVAFSVNPTQRLSVGTTWEQRRETEKYSQLDVEGKLPAAPISDLRQFEQTTELNLQYQLSRAVRWSGIGGYKRTTDQEQLDENPEPAKTRTFSFENRVTYSLIGKGRIDVNYKLGYGESMGGDAFAQYYFYEGISHEVRTTADYKLRKFTDLLLRLNYRLLSTKQRKPEHRLEMTVSAEL